MSIKVESVDFVRKLKLKSLHIFKKTVRIHICRYSGGKGQKTKVCDLDLLLYLVFNS